MAPDRTWVATKDYAESLQAAECAPLAALVATFVAGGGQLWVCGACAKPRNITAETLVEGAQIVGAAKAVMQNVNGV